MVKRALSLSLLLGFGGCEGGSGPASLDAFARMDAGVSDPVDAATSSVPDTGPAPSGTCGPWDGVVGTTIAALPDSCLPRCTAETELAVRDCLDSECLVAAVMADALPSVAMTVVGASRPFDLSCQFCYSLQQFHCASLVCPATASPALSCSAPTDPDGCAEEFEALNGCLDTLPEVDAETFNTCFQAAVGACFSND